MRTKPSYDELLDDELLEPLPVLVDGAPVTPVSAADARPHTDAPHAFEAIGAVCTRIVETRGLGALRPWLGPQSAVPETLPPIPPTTFGRIIELQPACLGSLPGWWQEHALGDRVTIARRLTLRAPRHAGDGVWRMRATLRDPIRPRPVRMELSLWRHLDGWTKVTLEPRHRIFVKGLYFDVGHRCLDVLCDQLTNELRGGCR